MKQYSLNLDQKQAVIDKTRHYIDMANQLLELDLPDIDIKFDLKGKSSGMFEVRHKLKRIRYNEMIFSAYFDDALINTVAHEVAHYVVSSIWGFKKVKPHGREWKEVMSLFQVKPDVTSDYDVSLIPLRQQKRYKYLCACTSHQITTTRHNKVQSNKVVYCCRKCQQPIKLALE